MFRTTLMALVASSLLSTAAVSQATQLVRGDVDSVRNTNRFVLDCTQIPLVSTAVNLQALHDASRQRDISYEMRVRNVGTATSPILDVISAREIPEIMDMGNLRFGRSDSWEVRGASGSLAVVFLQARSLTSYLPLGGAGAWLLGPSAGLFRAGTIVGGQFRFNFQPPAIPSLVGQEFSSQALLVAPSGALTISDPDCKEVRSN